MEFDICCIGHLTLDKVVNRQSIKHMPGGTSFYFSNALQHFNLNYLLVTALARQDEGIVDSLRHHGIQVQAHPSAHTVYFENIYGDNQNQRSQNVLQQADPFTIAQLESINAGYFHLGTLLAHDIPPGLIKSLAGRGKISIDVQGCLREVINQKVQPIDWIEKEQVLPYIDILKANDEELSVLTGTSDLKQGAQLLAAQGVNEVVITLGSQGSLIYADRTFYTIPAYIPPAITDATGCGDTYMAGYLYQRFKGLDVQQSGEFAAAMAGVKIERSGPFNGTEQDVLSFLSTFQQNW